MKDIVASHSLIKIMTSVSQNVVKKCNKDSSSRPEVFCEKRVLEISQNSQENTYARSSNFIKKEALAQVFSSEFCEIPKNTFS